MIHESVYLQIELTALNVSTDAALYISIISSVKELINDYVPFFFFKNNFISRWVTIVSQSREKRNKYWIIMGEKKCKIRDIKKNIGNAKVHPQWKFTTGAVLRQYCAVL